MILQNKGGAVIVMPLTFTARGELKNYIKGDLSFDEFWNGFSIVAKKIVTTGFEPDSVKYPAVFSFKDMSIRLDEPYTLNGTVALHHGGTVDDVSIPLIKRKTKGIFKTASLTSGVVVETPLCLIVSAQLKKAFALERQRRSYDSWTMAGKLRSQQMMDSIDNELLNFKNHPAISFIFPENAFIMQDGNFYISSLSEVPWLNGVERVGITEISAVNNALLADFLDKAVDLYKGIYGFNGTIEELRSQLLAYGVTVTVPSEWIKLHDKTILNGQITPELRSFLEQFPEQVLSTFPYYVRHAYGGLDLTGSELASTMYDFTRVINKFTNRTVKYRAEDQFTSIYELMAVIMKGLNEEMTLLDISDFIIFHNLRTGAIRFQYKNGPSDLQLDEYNKIRELTKNLTVKASDSSFANQLEKTVDGDLQLNLNGRLFTFEVIAGQHIVNKAEVIDCLLSNRTKGYKAVEVLECIEGLYLACLDPSIRPGDLYNLVEGVFKYTIPTAYLNSQLHPGFVTANFNIYIPGE